LWVIITGILVTSRQLLLDT